MLRLHEIQEQFMQGLYVPDSVDAEVFIQANEQQTATQRLQAYRHSLLGHLHQVLSEIYPVCQRLLGEAFFEKLGVRYIKANPSNSLNLHDYGESFAEFLTNFPPLADYPYLPDVARLEWHWHRAFHARDEDGLDMQALSNLSTDDMPHLHFRLPASSRLLHSDYPIQQIWAVNQPEYKGEQTIDLAQGGCYLMIWRYAYEMRIDELSQAEWLFLSAINAGESFSGVCERLPQEYSDCNPAQLAPQCVERGYINDFYIAN